VNGAGKSTVIQSLLLILQSQLNEVIPFNGSFLDLGAFKDVFFEFSDENDFSVKLAVDGEAYTWKAHELSGRQLELEDNTKRKRDFSGLEKLRKNFEYLCAERWGPRAHLPLLNEGNLSNRLGMRGENAVQILDQLSKDTARSVAKAFGQHDKRQHGQERSQNLLRNIDAWMSEISPGAKLNFKTYEDAAIGVTGFSFTSKSGASTANFRASNVGFGLSYAQGIVIALICAKKGDVILIENPEAHLHPRGQSQLGRLMALAACSGVQVIVETHSEHVLNGARIIVRKGVLDFDDMNVMFISRDDTLPESKIDFLKINEMGQLETWPEGFFDQQALDMQTLIIGK